MGLILGPNAIADTLIIALRTIYKTVSVDKMADNTYKFSEKDDGSNRHELLQANITVGNSVKETVIIITPVGISLTEIKTVVKKFFKDYGYCTINIP